MKKRRIIILIALLVLVGAMFLAFNPRKTAIIEGIQTNNATNNQVQSANIIQGRSILTDPLGDSRKAMDYQSIKSGRIDVSGKVVDQFDSPLKNTLIEFAVGGTDFYSSSQKMGKTTTDEFGNFKISGYDGSAIRIDPKADGYVLVATNNRVIYSGSLKNDPLHISNGGTHRVIRMWKLRGGEELVRVSKTFRFSGTDAPIYIDLVRGELRPNGGDIKVSIERPVGNVSTKEQARWVVTFSSEDGGIQQVDDLAFQWTYEAPTNGYQKEIRVEQLPGDRMWSTHAGAGAFVTSRHGKVYSKVGIGFDLNEEPDKPCSVKIHSLSNSNSSRNWEEESSKVRTLH